MVRRGSVPHAARAGTATPPRWRMTAEVLRNPSKRVSHFKVSLVLAELAWRTLNVPGSAGSTTIFVLLTEYTLFIRCLLQHRDPGIGSCRGPAFLSSQHDAARDYTLREGASVAILASTIFGLTLLRSAALSNAAAVSRRRAKNGVTSSLFCIRLPRQKFRKFSNL